MRVQTHPISAPHSSAHYDLTSLHFGGGAGPRAYLHAALHADEVPGMLVAQVLRRELQRLEHAGLLRGEVILVPAANPIGRAQAVHGAPFGRFDLATGINFNRGFRHVADQLKQSLPGLLVDDAAANTRIIRRHAEAAVAAWQPRSDAEALKKTLLGLAIGADIVLDLHCDNQAVLHMYTGTPLAPAMQALADLLGAQALLLALEAGDEPFDEACSRLWWELADHFGPQWPILPACLAATIELRGERDVSHALAQQDADAILRFLTLHGVIDSKAFPDPAALPAARCAATPLEGVEPLLAPHAGILVYRRELGEPVAAGDVIAELIDPVSGQTTELCSSVSGVFFAGSAFRHVLRGMNVGKVAGATAFRAGKLLSL
ncbi:MAG: succinylglutamate desuccinylase/aspartoacylase family protein [Sphingomonadaceae bacterium]